jgi:hypothetical protein
MSVAAASRWFAAILLLLISAVAHADGGPGFRRIRDTLSPNGAYVIAWGWGLEEKDDPKTLKEWKPKRDNDEGEIQNYLVDAVKARVLHVFQEGGAYFETSDGHFQRFSGFDATWSDDSQRAIIIYDGRFGDGSLLWVNAARRTSHNIAEKLQEVMGKHIAKEDKLPEDEELQSFWFSYPVILPDDVFVIDVKAKRNAPAEREHLYRFKVKVSGLGEELQCKLLDGRKTPEAEDYFAIDDEKARAELLEKDLNEIYGRLRAKLSEAEKKTLKEKQVQWLKKREATNKDYRDVVTAERVAYLRAWAER